jgi:predicted RNA-binding protein with TRAM domain
MPYNKKRRTGRDFRFKPNRRPYYDNHGTKTSSVDVRPRPNLTSVQSSNNENIIPLKEGERYNVTLINYGIHGDMIARYAPSQPKVIIRGAQSLYNTPDILGQTVCCLIEVMKERYALARLVKGDS